MSKTMTTAEIEAAAERALDDIERALGEIDSCARKLERRGFSSAESRARLSSKARALDAGSSKGLTWLSVLHSELFTDNLSHVDGSPRP